MHQLSILNVDLADNSTTVDSLEARAADLERAAHERECGPCPVRTSVIRERYATTVRAWTECEI